MRNSDLKIPILYLALVMVWGTTWSAIKVSVGDTPFLLASIRFFMASATLLIIQLFRKRTILPPRESLKVVITIGVGNFSFGYGLTYWGMQFVLSNLSSLLWATMPVIVSIYAHFMMQNEKLSSTKIFSLVGALLGSYLIFDIHGQDFNPDSAMGMSVILLAIIIASYSNVLYKREGSHLDPVSMNLAGMFIGSILLLMTGLLLEPLESVELDLVTMTATIYLAVFGSAFGFTLYFWLFKHISVVKLSYTTFLIPIFASFWGWLFLDEGFTPGTIAGGVIILLSISLPELKFFRRDIN